MKKQLTNLTREQFLIPEPADFKFNGSNQPVSQYIQFLRTQIKHLGTQIDSEFQRSSEFIFSLYKHYYSPSQHPGEKETLLNKLSNAGVQWALQSTLQQKAEQAEALSEQVRSVNPTPSENKELQNSKKAYNIRAKTKPQKYRYNIEEEYDYGDRATPRQEGSKRGRPSGKRENDNQSRRDISNPYEKAPYKKRRLPAPVEQEPKEESLKDEIARSSVKWEGQSEEEKEGNDLGKSMPEDRSEVDKEGNAGVSDKMIKSSQEVNRLPIGKGEAMDIQVDRYSHLVEQYRKNWENFKLQIQIQSENL